MSAWTRIYTGSYLLESYLGVTVRTDPVPDLLPSGGQGDLDAFPVIGDLGIRRELSTIALRRQFIRHIGGKGPGSEYNAGNSHLVNRRGINARRHLHA